MTQTGPNKERIDSLLFIRGLVKSRSAAQTLIKKGVVFCNGEKILKPAAMVNRDSEIKLTAQLPYVGRGGEKLEGAINAFSLDFHEKTILDIGSSTGGFTDCSLKHGAKRVVAVDVGTMQMDQGLRENPLVELHEQTDIRKFQTDERFQIIVIDVSFISLTEILPKAKELLEEKGSIVALIKPQFEVGQDNLSKKGIVKEEKSIQEAIMKIKTQATHLGLEMKKIIPSPILGGDGNQEFLVEFSINSLAGIHTVWKPLGPSSNQFLNQLRKILNKKKIGHAGTLDPEAQGVLVIGIDREGTRELTHYIKQDKEYIATLFLGAISETDDKEGPITKTNPSNIQPSEQEIMEILKRFTGTITQKPPKYSALKINGKPAYERARKGEVLNLPERQVEITNIEIISYQFPLLTIKVSCGSGTYIRTLSKDIGESLGTGAYLESLTRTRVGCFTEETLWNYQEFTK